MWAKQVPHSWVVGDDELGRHTRFRHELRERGERYVLGVLQHDDARPGRPVARVSRVWTTAEATLAIGDRLATSAHLGCVDTVDGARR